MPPVERLKLKNVQGTDHTTVFQGKVAAGQKNAALPSHQQREHHVKVHLIEENVPGTGTTPNRNNAECSFTDILQLKWQSRNWQRHGQLSGANMHFMSSLFSDESFAMRDLRFALCPQTFASMYSSGASSVSLSMVRFMGWSLSKTWRYMFSKVEVDTSSFEGLKDAFEAEDSIVLLPSHRSHVDYLMLSYILFGMDLPVPVIAAGANLGVGILGQILRKAGAFFIRRSWKHDSDREKYSETIQKSITKFLTPLTSGGLGMPLEFFLEGGRTRDGTLHKPRTGLLKFVANSLLESAGTNSKCDDRVDRVADATLIPVSLTFDRVPEGAELARQRLGKAKEPESFSKVVSACFRMIGLGIDLPSKGKMYVRCGEPVSFRSLLPSSLSRPNLKNCISATAAHICSAQAFASVVPMTSLVVASVFSWLDNVHYQRLDHLHLKLETIVEDVRHLANMVDRCGGILPFRHGDLADEHAIRDAVVEALQVLGLNVIIKDAQQNATHEAGSNSEVVIMSGRPWTSEYHLEMASIMSQMIHVLLPSLRQLHRWFGQDLGALVADMLKSRYHYVLPTGNFMNKSTKENVEDPIASAREKRIVMALILTVVDVYFAVALCLHDLSCSLVDIKSLNAGELARQVQHYLACQMGKGASSLSIRDLSPESLALDTIEEAIEWCCTQDDLACTMNFLQSVQEKCAYHDCNTPVTRASLQSTNLQNDRSSLNFPGVLTTFIGSPVVLTA